MKKEQSTKKQLLSAIFSLALVFVMFLGSVTTFCWLTLDTKLDAKDIGARISSDINLKAQNVVIFKRDGGTGAKAYTVNEETHQMPEIELTEYDTIFTDRNVNTPIIICAEISGMKKTNGVFDPLVFTLIANNDSHNEWLNEFNHMNKCLSNIISVKCACGDKAILNNQETAEDTYKLAVDFLATKESKSFVTVTGSNQASKVNAISFTISDIGSYSYTQGSLDSVVVYIEIDYSPALVQLYVDQHSGSSGDFEDDEVIKFNSDLSSFTFTNGGEA